MVVFEKVSFAYPGGAPVFSDLSLSIGAGERVGLIGPNGAGKSTLVNLINGVLLPSSGTVKVDGLPVAKEHLEEIRRKAGVVFQNPDDMLFMPRVMEDVLFGPLNLGMGETAARREAERVLRELDLWELRDRPPFTLSQGQRRFAGLAAVLVMSPSLLVLDEPTSDLDPAHRRKLIGLLNTRAEARLTASHDLDFIWETCDRVLLLARGVIVADGPAKALLTRRDLLEDHGLELPLRLQGG